MYILSIKLCAFWAIAARIHSCPCLFLINYPCNSHQRLLISWISLMQMMLIWAFMIIHSSFINEVFTTARLWERRLTWELEGNWRWCSPWQAHRGSFDYLVLDGHLCLRARALLAAPASSSNSWAHHLILDECSIYSVFVLFEGQGQRKAVSLVLSISLPGKAEGCAGAAPCRG